MLVVHEGIMQSVGEQGNEMMLEEESSSVNSVGVLKSTNVLRAVRGAAVRRQRGRKAYDGRQ